MNYEYIRDLLYEESIKYNGFVSKSVHPLLTTGNDYYGNILEDRDILINKIDIQIGKIDEILKKRLPDETREKLEQIKKALGIRKENLKKFGYEHIEYRNNYYLKSIHKELTQRFSYMYYDYRVGYNTPEQFNRKLQALVDNIAPVYENKIRIQKLYEQQLLKDDHSLKENINLDDLSTTDSVADGFYFNEQDATKKRQSVENKTGVLSSIKNLQTRMKNITTGYLIDYNVINDYLKEFGILFIRVWGDETEW